MAYNNNQISIIDWNRFADFCANAHERLYLIIPSIDDKLAEGLLLAKNRNVDVMLCLDNSEETIRAGYGEVAGIARVRGAGIPIFESTGNRICFIVVDEDSWMWFYESPYLSLDAKSFNAFKVTDTQSTQLIQHYVGIYTLQSFVDTLGKDAERELLQVSGLVNNLEGAFDSGQSEPMNNETFKSIEKSVEENPPLTPDRHRQLKVYTNMFQYVQMEYKGGNIEQRSIKLPKDGLPIDDEDLKSKISATVKMFGDAEFSKRFPDVELIKAEIERVRAEYLVSVDNLRKGMSILKRSRRAEFDAEVAAIARQIGELNAKVPSALNQEFLKAKEQLRDLLLKHYSTNIPRKIREMFHFSPEEEARSVRHFVDEIMIKVKNPFSGKKGTEPFMLRLHYFDLTWEDINNGDLIQLFKDRGMLKKSELDKLAHIEDAIGVRL